MTAAPVAPAEPAHRVAERLIAAGRMADAAGG